MIASTPKLLNVALLFGGRSGEHQVSLMSAKSITASLDPSLFFVTQVYVTQQGKWLSGDDPLGCVQSGRTNILKPVALFPEPTGSTLFTRVDEKYVPYRDIDVFFPIIHGTFGEDGCLQGLFELANVAYVGAGVTGSALGMDKALFKDVMRAHQIPVVDSVTISATENRKNPEETIHLIESAFPYPVFVKPVNMGSSVGVSKCKDRSELLVGIREGLRYDRRILVEKGVDAREIEVSVLGNSFPEASIPGEIVPADDFYSYRAKYIDENSQLIIPAPLSNTLKEEAMTLAVKAFSAADCAGMARVDFLLDRESDHLFLNEINTIPGFTKISMYPKLWEASGMAYQKLLEKLIHLGLERKTERDQLERVYKGNK